jgi:hypothetical protein
LGEIPTVQERFQAVLKRRLQLQIQDHPPLFPWEDGLVEYPEFLEESSIGLFPALGWLAQQSHLNLPLALPDQVFQQLVGKCQVLLASSLPLGAKLVKAVEDLFPEDLLGVNDLAGLVLRSPNRSIVTLDQQVSIQSDYSDLIPRQQMALSLMAAKQLLEIFTLPISLTHPLVERQLLTPVGIVSIRLELKSLDDVLLLTVQSHLPTPGALHLQGDDIQAIAESDDSGDVALEYRCGQDSQNYTLEIALPELGEQPLSLKIMLTV